MPATLLLALSATAANGPAPTSAPFPYAPSTYPKVQLQLDPMAYRSASQGPVMPKELQPATKSDYDEIDTVINRVTRTHGWSPVIMQYKKHHLWQQWEGTILERLWKNAVYNMLVPTILLLAARRADPTWSWWKLPKDHVLADTLLAISSGWNYLLTLTTFVTTFFVGHSHDFWRKSYQLSRSVQGRLNDIGLLCATHASRTPSGELTPPAEDLLAATARNLRLVQCLFYADVCYRKTVRAGSQTPEASVRLLLAFDRTSRTAPGLQRLHDRGLLTDREYETLVSVALPPSRWYLVVLEWAAARIVMAHKRGLLVGGPGFEAAICGKICDLRSACMSIPDELAARMPLAYVHFTHCLVDVLMMITPFGLYPHLGIFAIPMTGVMALFYRGLLELSKSFLDPFGNRRVSFSGLSADISVDCLIGETNAGSLVWPQAAKRLPFD